MQISKNGPDHDGFGGRLVLKTMAKILIVEDEAITAMSIRLKLTSMGYEVCGLVSKGEEALERIRVHKPDLVIMDVGLPGKMNGLETAREIRKIHEAGIIFITGYYDEGMEAEGMGMGNSRFLQKPFRPGDIERLVKEVFREQK
ncbi:MAG: response regulator [Deltaproteobacteria bacterium]|nr:response regulator [Deltaproteobacteria bacterium]